MSDFARLFRMRNEYLSAIFAAFLFFAWLPAVGFAAKADLARYDGIWEVDWTKKEKRPGRMLTDLRLSGDRPHEKTVLFSDKGPDQSWLRFLTGDDIRSDGNAVYLERENGIRHRLELSGPDRLRTTFIGDMLLVNESRRIPEPPGGIWGGELPLSLRLQQAWKGEKGEELHIDPDKGELRLSGVSSLGESGAVFALRLIFSKKDFVHYFLTAPSDDGITMVSVEVVNIGVPSLATVLLTRREQRSGEGTRTENLGHFRPME